MADSQINILVEEDDDFINGLEVLDAWDESDVINKNNNLEKKNQDLHIEIHNVVEHRRSEKVTKNADCKIKEANGYESVIRKSVHVDKVVQVQTRTATANVKPFNICVQEATDLKKGFKTEQPTENSKTIIQAKMLAECTLQNSSNKDVKLFVKTDGQLKTDYKKVSKSEIQKDNNENQNVPKESETPTQTKLSTESKLQNGSSSNDKKLINFNAHSKTDSNESSTRETKKMNNENQKHLQTPEAPTRTKLSEGTSLPNGLNNDVKKWIKTGGQMDSKEIFKSEIKKVNNDNQKRPEKCGAPTRTKSLVGSTFLNGTNNKFQKLIKSNAHLRKDSVEIIKNKIKKMNNTNTMSKTVSKEIGKSKIEKMNNENQKNPELSKATARTKLSTGSTPQNDSIDVKKLIKTDCQSSRDFKEISKMEIIRISRKQKHPEKSEASTRGKLSTESTPQNSTNNNLQKVNKTKSHLKPDFLGISKGESTLQSGSNNDAKKLIKIDRQSKTDCFKSDIRKVSNEIQKCPEKYVASSRTELSASSSYNVRKLINTDVHSKADFKEIGKSDIKKMNNENQKCSEKSVALTQIKSSLKSILQNCSNNNAQEVIKIDAHLKNDSKEISKGELKKVNSENKNRQETSKSSVQTKLVAQSTFQNGTNNYDKKLIESDGHLKTEFKEIGKCKINIYNVNEKHSQKFEALTRTKLSAESTLQNGSNKLVVLDAWNEDDAIEKDNKLDKQKPNVHERIPNVVEQKWQNGKTTDDNIKNTNHVIKETNDHKSVIQISVFQVDNVIRVKTITATSNSNHTPQSTKNNKTYMQTETLAANTLQNDSNRDVEKLIKANGQVKENFYQISRSEITKVNHENQKHPEKSEDLTGIKSAAVSTLQNGFEVLYEWSENDTIINKDNTLENKNVHTEIQDVFESKDVKKLIKKNTKAISKSEIKKVNNENEKHPVKRNLPIQTRSSPENTLQYGSKNNLEVFKSDALFKIDSNRYDKCEIETETIYKTFDEYQLKTNVYKDFVNSKTLNVHSQLKTSLKQTDKNSFVKANNHNVKQWPQENTVESLASAAVFKVIDVSLVPNVKLQSEMDLKMYNPIEKVNTNSQNQSQISKKVNSVHAKLENNLNTIENAHITFDNKSQIQPVKSKIIVQKNEFNTGVETIVTRNSNKDKNYKGAKDNTDTSKTNVKILNVSEQQLKADIMKSSEELKNSKTVNRTMPEGIKIISKTLKMIVNNKSKLDSNIDIIKNCNNSKIEEEDAAVKTILVCTELNGANIITPNEVKNVEGINLAGASRKNKCTMMISQNRLNDFTSDLEKSVTVSSKRLKLDSGNAILYNDHMLKINDEEHTRKIKEATGDCITNAVTLGQTSEFDLTETNQAKTNEKVIDQQVTEKLKLVETGLIPPGTEIEADLKSLKLVEEGAKEKNVETIISTPVPKSIRSSDEINIRTVSLRQIPLQKQQCLERNSPYKPTTLRRKSYLEEKRNWARIVQERRKREAKSKEEGTGKCHKSRSLCNMRLSAPVSDASKGLRRNSILEEKRKRGRECSPQKNDDRNISPRRILSRSPISRRSRSPRRIYYRSSEEKCECGYSSRKQKRYGKWRSTDSEECKRIKRHQPENGNGFLQELMQKLKHDVPSPFTEVCKSINGTTNNLLPVVMDAGQITYPSLIYSPMHVPTNVIVPDPATQIVCLPHINTSMACQANALVSDLMMTAGQTPYPFPIYPSAVHEQLDNPLLHAMSLVPHNLPNGHSNILTHVPIVTCPPSFFPNIAHIPAQDSFMPFIPRSAIPEEFYNVGPSHLAQAVLGSTPESQKISPIFASSAEKAVSTKQSIFSFSLDSKNQMSGSGQLFGREHGASIFPSAFTVADYNSSLVGDMRRLHNDYDSAPVQQIEQIRAAMSNSTFDNNQFADMAHAKNIGHKMRDAGKHRLPNLRNSRVEPTMCCYVISRCEDALERLSDIPPTNGRFIHKKRIKTKKFLSKKIQNIHFLCTSMSKDDFAIEKQMKHILSKLPLYEEVSFNKQDNPTTPRSLQVVAEICGIPPSKNWNEVALVQHTEAPFNIDNIANNVPWRANTEGSKSDWLPNKDANGHQPHPSHSINQRSVEQYIKEESPDSYEDEDMKTPPPPPIISSVLQHVEKGTGDASHFGLQYNNNLGFKNLPK